MSVLMMESVDVMTLQDVAGTLGICRQTVVSRANRGELPAPLMKVKRQWFWLRPAIEEYRLRLKKGVTGVR